MKQRKNPESILDRMVFLCHSMESKKRQRIELRYQ